MKKHLLLAALFVSTSAFACPDLSGTWSCKDSDNAQSKITVTQEAIPDGTVYHITDDASGKTEDLYADGKPHDVQAEHYTGTMTAVCHNDMSIDAHVDFANPEYNLMGTADVSVIKVDDNNFTTATTVKYSINKGAETTKLMSASCTK